MILYIGEPKDLIKRLPELMTDSGREAGYKIKEQKSKGLCTNNSMSDKQLLSTVSFSGES